MLFYLEHAIQDASLDAPGERASSRKRMLYVEIDATGTRAISATRPTSTTGRWRRRRAGVAPILARPECAWIGPRAGAEGAGHAIAHVVPEHLAEVRDAQARR